ncbi:MAG: HyaD/HybD family hydrogenase maturation endopeptidase [Gammaproteobacteria bacterium]|nr:HyaD/HybD family hydrogenase maturation endopeptidase [Gammaproteobacteria bacterium]MCB1903667.1 HyaD/HybD family hydrogenase maturation endopeptidase [Gammaproteobacteria bacterium]
MSTLVLGIGNVLLTDEGVGVHVINRLEQKYTGFQDVRFLDGGTLSFSLAAELAKHNRLIVVDAAHTGRSPGSVVCLEGGDVDRYMKGDRKSVHEVGLGDLLDMARLAAHYPEKIALVGIEPFSIEWGSTLSPAVEKSICVAMEAVVQLLCRWHGTLTENDTDGLC